MIFFFFHSAQKHLEQRKTYNVNMGEETLSINEWKVETSFQSKEGDNCKFVACTDFCFQAINMMSLNKKLGRDAQKHTLHSISTAQMHKKHIRS